MKKLANKLYVTALCLLVVVAMSTTADAQKKRSTKSSRSRTSKTQIKKSYKPARTTSVPVDTATQVNYAQAPTQQPGIKPAVQDTMPQDTLPPMDGYYKNDMFNNAKAFSYPGISSRDVRFYKRVWRDIDINDPKNSLFNTPGSQTLGDIIVEGIRTGKLTAYMPSIYNANDSTFAHRLSIPAAMRLLQGAEVAVKQFNEKGEEIGTKMTRNDFNPASLVKFRTKEDVYFDKKRAMVVTRIIGIAPIKSTEAAGQAIEAPVFWLYFPQCRDFFATKDVSDPDRNIYDTSLDDVFVQGKYVSNIVRATGSNASRAASQQIAAAATTGSAADALAAATGQDKTAVAKQTEEQIQQFKEKTWEYDIKKTPTAAEKKAAANAAKQAAKAEKDAQKAANNASKQASKTTASADIKKPQ
ncbi:gliding motility protein GldN [Mucilaginibacter daejeonensis]|uniref:type IX secretion system ring protein PorN/GldN n=1 Tax=Mucilaginibacter daejeonensis TaxID=398049 RepID=UPI001D171DDC|nr:gliding motility protein GldN [Mucilaginibacter daejeonensis]UEG52642.1 gliding motility protein GldN [Mucilaginibacter daejeonensis]